MSYATSLISVWMYNRSRPWSGIGTSTAVMIPVSRCDFRGLRAATAFCLIKYIIHNNMPVTTTVDPCGYHDGPPVSQETSMPLAASGARR